jgi:AAA family ATP:ADP antiporter
MVSAEFAKPAVTFIERLLNLRRGDLSRGLPLFFYNFLIISSFVVGQVVRDTLFLNRFEPQDLPYVDMTIAAFVLIVVTGYSHARKFMALQTLQTVTLLLFALITGIFWLLTWTYHWTWLYPALYVWVGIFGVLAPAQMWMLIIYLLSSRDKRLLGLVASGGIAGGMAGFVSRAIVHRFDAEHLLFFMLLLLLAAAALIAYVWRRWQSKLSGMPVSDKDETNTDAWNLRESLKLINRSSHLKAIGALVCLSSVVTNIAGWQFKANAAMSFVLKNDLAAFFGTFYGYVSVLGFLVAQVLAPRILVVSIGLALFLLPLALLAGTAGVLLSGTLWTTTLLKGSDKILRYAIEKPAVESLYFPVPSRIMIRVKMFIDTISWRLGDGLAGIVVFMFATLLNFNIRQLSWIMLVLLFVWLVTAYIARQQYIKTLSEGLRQHRFDREQTSSQQLDRATSEILAERLRTDDTGEILYALGLIDPDQHQLVHPVLHDLLVHGDAEVRSRSLAILNAAGDKTVANRVRKLLHDSDPGVRTEALLYLAHHMNIDPLEEIEKLADYSDFSVNSAVITFLVRSGNPDNQIAAREILHNMIEQQGTDGRRSRIEAAKIFASLPGIFEDQLAVLIRDEDTDVFSQAIRALNENTSEQIIATVISKLGSSALSGKIIEALSVCGDAIIKPLEDHISDSSCPIAVRREIPAVLVEIGSTAAVNVLMDNLLTEETELRSRVIGVLTDLQKKNPAAVSDKQAIDTLLIAEIIGHYRSRQIRDVMEGALESDDTVLQALRKIIDEELERIFSLIKLLNPHHDLDSAYYGVQSANPEVRGNALEFLENILRPELRNLILPAIDPDISSGRRTKLTHRLTGTSIDTPVDALLTLLAQPEPWLKSCAVYSIGVLGLSSLEDKLDECLTHPDPLLRETARQAQQKLREQKSERLDSSGT